MDETLESKIDFLRERLGIALAQGLPHASDCAVHNAPAQDPGPCDCGTGTWKDLAEGLVGQFDHAGCTCTFPDDQCCPFAKASTAFGSMVQS